MNKETGEPAFPSHGSMGEVIQEGMTLRDYFAAKAMPFAMERSNGTTEAAQRAYLMADEMLKAREK